MAGTTPIDQLVDKLLQRIDEKSHSSIDTELIEKFMSKVDDHDKTLMLMAKTMEDINRILSDFSDTNKSLRQDMAQYQKDQIKHWQNQDKLMAQNELTMKHLADGMERFKAIEHKQNEVGCASLNNAINSRKEHDKLFEIKMQHLEERIEALEEDIKAMKEQPKKRMETVVTEVIKYVVVFVMGAVLLKFGIGGK